MGIIRHTRALRDVRVFRNICILAVIVAALGLLLFAASQNAGAQGQNLLQNPGFEGSFYTFNPDEYSWVALYGTQREDCKTSDGQYLQCNTAQVPNGWIPWWISQTDSDPDWKNRMPEYKPAQMPFANRIHSGSFAAQYFTFHSTHTAGLLQVVDVPANAQVRFTIWGQAWSSASDTDFSDFPTAVNMRIGIDPTGGTNPYGASIVWSDYKQPYDNYQQFAVEAQAQGTSVTVFTISSPDEARKHNDIYWDDASLTVLGSGAAPPPAPTQESANSGGDDASTTSGDASGSGDSGADDTTAAVAQAQPAVGPTSTPNADGIIYAEVQPGDSYWSIAARHGLTIDEIYELNNAGEGDFVQPGDLLVVGHAEPQATATPTEEPQEDEAAAEDAEAATAPPTATPTPQLAEGEVCLVAYRDGNQNAQRDAGEPLKSAVAFTVYDGEQVLVNYITDGNSEPYCISLDRGNYRITRSSQPNETLTTDGEWAISVSAGSEQTFEFGSVVEEEAQVAEVDADAGDDAQAASAAEDTTQMAPAEGVAPEEDGGVTRLIVIAAVVVAVLLFVGVLIIILSARRSSI